MVKKKVHKRDCVQVYSYTLPDGSSHTCLKEYQEDLKLTASTNDIIDIDTESETRAVFLMRTTEGWDPLFVEERYKYKGPPEEWRNN